MTKVNKDKCELYNRLMASIPHLREIDSAYFADFDISDQLVAKSDPTALSTSQVLFNWLFIDNRLYTTNAKSFFELKNGKPHNAIDKIENCFKIGMVEITRPIATSIFRMPGKGDIILDLHEKDGLTGTVIKFNHNKKAAMPLFAKHDRGSIYAEYNSFIEMNKLLSYYHL